MKLELAKAGNHNDILISEEDIREMVENFESDIPITIGHEMDDSMPAYGWIKSVQSSADGKTLIGEIELGEELEKAISEGKYKNWSIGAGRDSEGKMYLHHLAFLGAVPPMIKDLKIIEMGDKSEIITFTMEPACADLTLSDIRLAELSNLRKEKRQTMLTQLSDATAGKLPFGKREELLKFADSQLAGEREDIVEMLTNLFESVKHPVKQGLSESLTTARKAEMRSVFSKI